MTSRREFLSAIGAGLASAQFSLPAAECADSGQERSDKKNSSRKKLAIVTTVWRYQSHAQHMGDRFLVGYPMDGQWRKPSLDVVSLYVDQTPAGDQSRQRAEEFGFTIYPTIAETLRRGGKQLDVDAVLVIGEHGEYERNELGQKKYPRYEFFKQVTDVFRKDGKSVPVFNDKHLSWKWEWAKEMVDTAHELKFPLMAGSSLPVTWRMPDVEMPWAADVEEAISIAPGSVDSYDFHALEVLQCMTERRRGGETGVAWVQGLRGDAVWKALDAGSFKSGGFSRDLLGACLNRSQKLVSPKKGFGHRLPTTAEIHTMVPDPVCYRIQYTDGTRAAMLLLNGLIGDFTFAAKLKNAAKPLSTLFHLPPTPNVHYSAVLMQRAEQMFLSGKATYPVERTLLTSGVLAASIKSMATDQKKHQTSHLNVKYEATRQSTYCRS